METKIAAAKHLENLHNAIMKFAFSTPIYFSYNKRHYEWGNS